MVKRLPLLLLLLLLGCGGGEGREREREREGGREKRFVEDPLMAASWNLVGTQKGSMSERNYFQKSFHAHMHIHTTNTHTHMGFDPLRRQPQCYGGMDQWI